MKRIYPKPTGRKGVITVGGSQGVMRRISSVRRRERTGPGTEFKRLTQELQIELSPPAARGKGCGGCNELANRMDRMGVEGCTRRFDALLDEITPRAQEWWRKTSQIKKGLVLLRSRQPFLCKLAAAGRVTAGQFGIMNMLVAVTGRGDLDNSIENELRRQLARLLADAIAIAAEKQERLMAQGEGALAQSANQVLILNTESQTNMRKCSCCCCENCPPLCLLWNSTGCYECTDRLLLRTGVDETDPRSCESNDCGEYLLEAGVDGCTDFIQGLVTAGVDCCYVTGEAVGDFGCWALPDGSLLGIVIEIVNCDPFSAVFEGSCTDCNEPGEVLGQFSGTLVETDCG